MGWRGRRLTIWIGVVIACVGIAVTVVYFFQPRRTCPYDDAPSACAMLPVDATVMMIAMCSTVIGFASACFGLFATRPGSVP